MTTPVGELFLLGFRGAKIPPWLHSFARDFGLGGVLLFDYDCTDRAYSRNVFAREQLRELCTQIHALPSRPLVYVDQEGGKVRRLKERNGFAPLPSAKALPKLEASERQGLLRAAFVEMRELGIDINLAPVIDLDSNPLNPDIGAVERSYSADPSVVRQMAEEMLTAAQGVGLCLKHFPGCGGATVNSHTDLMDLSDSVEQEQLQLFSQLLERIPMVLLSHGVVRQWEADVPVSLSPVAVSKVRAMREEALIVTDDLQMAGLQKLSSTDEACRAAIRAGVDLLCLGNNLIDQEAACSGFAQKLLEALPRDPLLQRNFKESLTRLRQLKARYQ
jgi:beta-N-acetylhexosaminidase